MSPVDRVGLLLVACAALCGCDSRGVTEGDPQAWEPVGLPPYPSTGLRIDLVVLVDDSRSMAEEQAALAHAFPELLEELLEPAADPSTGRLAHPPLDDLNVGVISTDMGTGGYPWPTCPEPVSGDAGCFRHDPSPLVPGCSATYPAFLSRNESNLGTYGPEHLANDFTCIATLGADGCGWEQPLESMRWALGPNAMPGGCNQGFLRPDSLRALLFVTDEDDCSVAAEHSDVFNPAGPGGGAPMNVRCIAYPGVLEPVAEFARAFRALVPADEPERLFLAMIVGVPPDFPACTGYGDELSGCLANPAMRPALDPANPDWLLPSCDTGMGPAYPPVRMVRLAESFGRGAYVASICRDDWREPLREIARALAARLWPPACFPRTLNLRDFATCTADCYLVETLSDDRPCRPDPACPPEWCPPVTVDEAGDPPPCVDPATTDICRPLKRDLGLHEMPWGAASRQCLTRQAAQECVADRCAAPLESGWYHLAPGALDPGPPPDPPCPQIRFAPQEAGVPLLEVGSTGELRCLSYFCPDERRCGPRSERDWCCPEDEVCDRPVTCSHPRGTCVPAP